VWEREKVGEGKGAKISFSYLAWSFFALLFLCPFELFSGFAIVTAKAEKMRLLPPLL
jgi:hypothetical protein